MQFAKAFIATLVVLLFSSVAASSLANNPAFAALFPKEDYFDFISYQNITAADLVKHYNINNGAIDIVDVREPSEYALEKIPNAQNFPLSTFHEHKYSLPNMEGNVITKDIFIHCKTGVRSLRYIQMLLAEGITGKIWNIQGGIEGWVAAGGPVDANISAKDLVDLYRLGKIDIVDVREENEYKEGHIPGALSAPLSRFQEMKHLLPNIVNKIVVKPTYYHCKGGVRSLKFLDLLKAEGVTGHMFNVLGGFDAWVAANGPVTRD